MAYIYHNKDNDRYLIFGNMKAIEINTGINRETLVSCFTRKKNIKYEKDSIVIVKTDVIKTYKKPNKK